MDAWKVATPLFFWACAHCGVALGQTKSSDDPSWGSQRLAVERSADAGRFEPAGSVGLADGASARIGPIGFKAASSSVGRNVEISCQDGSRWIWGGLRPQSPQYFEFDCSGLRWRLQLGRFGFDESPRAALAPEAASSRAPAAKTAQALSTHEALPSDKSVAAMVERWGGIWSADFDLPLARPDLVNQQLGLPSSRPLEETLGKLVAALAQTAPGKPQLSVEKVRGFWAVMGGAPAKLPQAAEFRLFEALDSDSSLSALVERWGGSWKGGFDLPMARPEAFNKSLGLPRAMTLDEALDGLVSMLAENAPQVPKLAVKKNPGSPRPMLVPVDSASK